MKQLFKIGLLLTAMFAVTEVAHAQKFGYVSSAAILAEMPEVKQAEANLEALEKQLQKKGQSEIEKFQTEYRDLQEKAGRGELSPKEQEEAAQRIQAKEQELAQMRQDMSTQIQEKQNELLQPIYEKVNVAIKAVAEENGYTMIFDEQVLLFKLDSDNVSNLVKAKLGI